MKLAASVVAFCYLLIATGIAPVAEAYVSTPVLGNAMSNCDFPTMFNPSMIPHAVLRLVRTV